MIETKEEWEEIKSDIQSDISTQHEKRLVTLIEALREVARPLNEIYIAGIIEKLDRLMNLEDGGYNPNVYAAIAEYLRARRALPEWTRE